MFRRLTTAACVVVSCAFQGMLVTTAAAAPLRYEDGVCTNVPDPEGFDFLCREWVGDKFTVTTLNDREFLSGFGFRFYWGGQDFANYTEGLVFDRSRRFTLTG